MPAGVYKDYETSKLLSMRVRCKEKCKDYNGKRPYWCSPDVDDECEVIDVVISGGQLWYDLAGYDDFLYDADCFEVIKDTPAEVIEEQELITA